jgi:phage terminase Nu1 subunit (DNA packaging protein)
MKASTITIEQLASLCNVTPPAVLGWIKAGMPVQVVGKKGRGSHKTELDLARCMRWYFHERHERLALDRARTELTAAQTARALRENRVADGALVDINVICAALADLVLVFRNVMLGLPTKLAPEVAGIVDVSVCKAILDRDIRHALIAMSEFDPRELPTLKRFRRRKNGSHETGR